jgi:hypothetical protein
MELAVYSIFMHDTNPVGASLLAMAPAHPTS